MLGGVNLIQEAKRRFLPVLYITLCYGTAICRAKVGVLTSIKAAEEIGLGKDF